MNSKESEESEKEKPFYSAKMGAILHSKGMIGVKRCLQNPIAISPKVTSRLRVQKEAKKAKNALLVEMEREMSSLRGGAPQKWKMENVSWNSATGSNSTLSIPILSGETSPNLTSPSIACLSYAIHPLRQTH